MYDVLFYDLNAARDRLFQLEMWRCQATGTMAEILGERMIDHDIGSNNWVLEGSMSESGYPIIANDPHRTSRIIKYLHFL